MVFCLILFLYLHIYYHLKTSDDLEVYTLKSPSKDKLEEICSIRQPVLFQYSNQDIFKQFTLSSLKDNQGVFDVQVRKVGDDLYLPILLKEAIGLFENDKEENYIHTISCGDPKDPPLLLIHGYAGSAVFFYLCLKEFSK